MVSFGFVYPGPKQCSLDGGVLNFHCGALIFFFLNFIFACFGFVVNFSPSFYCHFNLVQLRHNFYLF